MAVFSVRAERLEGRRLQGDRRAAIILDYLANPPRFLGCIQVYGTALSLVIGALTAPALNPTTLAWVRGLNLSASIESWLPSALSLTLVTLVILVFANLLPKQIGFAHAEQVVLITARISAIMLSLVRPLAIALEWVTKVMLRPFGVSIISASPVTESDIRILLQQGQEFGDIDAPETDIIDRTMRLSDIPVAQVQTPRELIEWLSLSVPMHDIREQLRNATHSFIPVCLTSLDDCIGVLRLGDLRKLPAKFSKDDLRKLLLPVFTVEHAATLLDVLEQLRIRNSRLALMKNDEQKVVGLVTLNVLAEAVLGPLRALDC